MNAGAGAGAGDKIIDDKFMIILLQDTPVICDSLYSLKRQTNILLIHFFQKYTDNG